MERFVRLTAPSGKGDFVVKLAALLLICGLLNHVRDVLTYGFAERNTFWNNLSDASFTALPMCAMALMLIGHQNALQKRLYRQATRDDLTDLPNRRWFMNNVPASIAPGQALLIVDIDHFKRVNDTFGHDVGDKILCEFARFLQVVAGDLNDCARIGGEEFAVFMHMVDQTRLMQVATEISAGFVYEQDGTRRQVTASVGITLGLEPCPRDVALKRADRATYDAKAKGRACFVISSGSAWPMESGVQLAAG